MTKNKKKLRRVEKRYSVTKSAQTLVLTGLLLAGGVGSALAWDNVSVVDKDETLTQNQNAVSLTITDGTLTSAYQVNVTTGPTTQNGGKLVLKDGGRLNTDSGIFNAGTITITGYKDGTRSGIYDKNSLAADGVYTFGADGTKGPTVTLIDGGGIEGKNISIASGHFSISGAASGLVTAPVLDAKEYWRKGSLIVADNDLEITGGTFDIGKQGQMVVGRPDLGETTNKGFAISKGTINLNGASWTEAAYLVATSTYGKDGNNNPIIDITNSAKFVLGDKTNTNSANLASGTATINVANGKFGVIAAANPIIDKGGLISVAEGGQLTIVDSMKSMDPAFKLSPAHPDAFDDVALRVVGSQLEIKNGGAMNIQGDVIVNPGVDPTDPTKYNPHGSGDIKVSAGGNVYISGTLHGSLTMAGGKATVMEYSTFFNSAHNKSMIDGTGDLTVGTLGALWNQNGEIIDNGTLDINTLSSTPTDIIEVTVLGENKDSAFLGGGKNAKLTVTDGILNLGSSDTGIVSNGGKFDGATIIAKDNTLNVKAAEWKLGALTVELDGNAHISGGKLTIDNALTNNATTNNDAAGMRVTNNGVLAGKSTLFVTDDGSGNYSKAGTLKNEIFTSGSGTLALTWDKSVTLTVDQLEDIKDAIQASGSSGLLSHSGATIDVANNGTGALEGTVTDDVAKKTGALLNGKIVGAADTGTAAAAAVTTGGFGADSLTVAGKGTTGTTSADITLDNTLTLTGANGTLVAVKDKDSNSVTNAKVTISAGDKTLNLGSTEAKKGSGHLNEVTLADGTANVTNGSYTVDSIKGTDNKDGTVNVAGVGTNLKSTTIEFGTGADTLNVASANLNAGSIKTGTGNDAINVTGSGVLIADSIETNASGIISVGNKDGAGTLKAKSLKLAGGILFTDPSWNVGGTLHPQDYGSRAAVSFPDNKVDGSVIVGKASQVALGTDNIEWLSASLGTMKTWGVGVTAALGIYAPTELQNTASSSIYVNGALDSNPGAQIANTANFAADSLLVVNAGAGLDTNVALKSTAGTLTVADTAKLRISGGKDGDTIHIVSGFTGVLSEIKAGGWNGANLTSDSGLMTVDRVGGDFTAADGSYDVVLTGHAATSVFPMLSNSMGGLVDTIVSKYGRDVESPNMGIKFISRATSDDHIGMNNPTQAAATIEGAAQLAVVGAVPAMTLGAVQAGTSAVTTRTSFASPLFDSTKAVAMHRDTDGTLSVDSGLNAGSSMKNGFGLWIMPLYQSNSAWGMEAENFKGGYKSDLGGVALGADYTVNDMFRFGLAFNIGGGYAESTGDFSKTDNSFSFWGINAYGGWSMNNFGITADVGYTGNYNKVKQELPGSMKMDDIKSDVTSSAWTAGLRGEYKFATEALDIIPHVGVRYTGLTTDEYKAKSGGDTVFKVDQDFQNIWTFPIGVTFAKEIETSSGWIVRPQVDLGITPATGDVKAKSKVRIPGVDAQAEMKMQVVDYMSYDGGVGLEMKKDNISFGINYNIQASEHRTGHGVFGTFRYEF